MARREWLQQASFAALLAACWLRQPCARFMRILFCLLWWMALLVAAGCSSTNRQPAGKASSGPDLPGKKADGSVLLPNMWSLRPAGTQIELRDFPVNVAVHPKGRFAAVLHSGYSAHVVSIVDLRLGKAV